ncbi:MAG: hypothetical protein M9894_23670 [Planctomycetes bacterium]|nr:hypothetical protein [Planctomycetota bacterium]
MDDRDETLHCAHNGWHPAIEVVIDRLERLTGRDRADLRQLVIDRTGAEQHDEHLIGSLGDALEVLRAAELDALRALFSLDSSRS